ncbi:MAG: BMP family ABC transporter substrate-binding protein, partial [Mycoplasma sp.]|nr:BMP family ABC transporter substrate-binding protein [Mycoplasma sp.]
MKKNKILLTGGGIGSLLFASSLFVACSCSKNSDKGVEHPKFYTPDDIAFVPDAGAIDDKSFNQQAWEALKKIHKNDKLKRENNVFQPKDTNAKTILETYYRVEGAGKKIVFANGFFHTDAILKYNKAKDKEGVSIDKRLKFFLADDDYFALEGTEKHTNVVSFKYDIIPAAHQAGVLVGEYFKRKGHKNTKIGFFGGAEPDAVTDFIKGFLAGIETFNKNEDNNSSYRVKVATPSKFKELLQTGFDASGGKDETKALIADGANVILPVAGPQFRNVITEISNLEESIKNKTKIIGVDVDQELSVKENEKEYYLTSILKNIKDTFYKIAFHIFINKIFDEKLQSDNFKEFKKSFLDDKTLLWGKTHYLTVDQEMTGIADIKEKKAWKG